MARSELWTPFPHANARIRLLCLPYAGGNASAYLPLADGLLPEAELITVQLPGRAARYREPAYCDLKTLVANLADSAQPLFTKPWVVFGHSFGCRVAFELVKELQRRSCRLPAHFIASGCAALHLQRDRRPRSGMSDRELTAELRLKGGTPTEVLESKELMRMTLSALRGDLAMMESHRVSARDCLPLPATVLAGRDDPCVPIEGLAAWQNHFSDRISIVTFDGGHFFINSQREQVVGQINRILMRSVALECSAEEQKASPHVHADLSYDAPSARQGH